MLPQNDFFVATGHRNERMQKGRYIDVAIIPGGPTKHLFFGEGNSI